jgi:hypothetical protein
MQRQRRGASVLRSSSKSRYTNESMIKFRKDFKDTSANFYEGLKYTKTKPKEQDAGTTFFLKEDEVEIE